VKDYFETHEVAEAKLPTLKDNFISEELYLSSYKYDIQS
jgi:hypothetical protein